MLGCNAISRHSRLGSDFDDLGVTFIIFESLLESRLPPWGHFKILMMMMMMLLMLMMMIMMMIIMLSSELWSESYFATGARSEPTDGVGGFTGYRFPQ